MTEKILYHTLESAAVLSQLQSDEHGLSSGEAKKRFESFGANELPEAKREGIWSLFFRQFQSPLIFILLVASVIVWWMGDFMDAGVILFVLFFNAVVGSIQEGKAQNTFLALKKFIKGSAVVLRDHQETIMPDRSIVPGDVIVLREGEKVPADARIIVANALSVNESALTGESLPKYKHALAVSLASASVSDQTNMVFKGTVVNSGHGKAVVVATGENTFLGTIAKETLGIDADFPLKRDMEKLSRFIIVFVAAVAGILFLLGLINGHSLTEIFKTIVAISVSVIPEGLPVALTIVLATGVWRMSKKHVLVKKLQAIEVLGETKILAVDKTGTVTKNELLIARVSVGGETFEVSGDGYVPEGEIRLRGETIDPLNHAGLLLAGKLALLNSSAGLLLQKGSHAWKIVGDPTEGAMLVFAQKIGFNRDDLFSEMPRLDEMPFDYERKYHASLHHSPTGNVLVTTGSPEVMLALSDREYHAEGDRPLTQARRRELDALFDALSRDGLRVIGFASATFEGENIERDGVPPLSFGGFFGIQDTLREEVREAVEKVEAAGMKVVMITGDHAVTARAIATKAGIYQEGDSVLDGSEIRDLNDAQLARRVPGVSVFSRVTPEHKLRIIQAYRAEGTVVAMTGDGVNDALSLSAADIGIGMGKIGTDVAKEASDLILLDDNFSNIVHGVEEGRNIFTSIKRVILYLFSTSLGEVLTLLAALSLGLPLPLLAAQILWLNLVTDGLLSLPLAMQPSEKKQKFIKTALVDKLMIERMLLMSLPMMFGTLFLFSQYYETDMEKAWTISLTVLAVFQWFNAWNCRSAQASIFSVNPFANRFLLGATTLTIVLHLLALYTPLLQSILRTVPLSAHDWSLILLVASSVLVLEETRKWFARSKVKMPKL